MEQNLKKALIGGGWNPSDQNPPPEPKMKLDFNIEDLLDDKMTKNILGDLKKHMPPGGFPKHKPLLVPSAGQMNMGSKA